jgi:hypothetical protein
MNKKITPMFQLKDYFNHLEELLPSYFKKISLNYVEAKENFKNQMKKFNFLKLKVLKMTL